MTLHRFLLYFIFIYNSLHSLEPYFDNVIAESIIETKQIVIPGHPHAFNPSIVRWKDRLLLCFREIRTRRSSSSSYGLDSRIGMVWLNEELEPVGEPSFLSLSNNFLSTTEDARLVMVANDLFIVYSDTLHNHFPGRGCRVFIANIEYHESRFSVHNIECLHIFEGETYERHEKNWVPFDYYGTLLLSYSLSPHHVFYPHLGTGYCESFSYYSAPIDWPWGELRGGTPAVLVDGQYLSFFHSSLELSSDYSSREPALHYFMGAYTFTMHYPFKVTRISPAPLFTDGLYRSPEYVPYWKPVRVIFPCGIVVEEDEIWVSLGKQDHEMWVVKFDKVLLINSLINTTH